MGDRAHGEAGHAEVVGAVSDRDHAATAVDWLVGRATIDRAGAPNGRKTGVEQTLIDEADAFERCAWVVVIATVCEAAERARTRSA